MGEKYLAWEFVKSSPYILLPYSYTFKGRSEPLLRLGKHYRSQLDGFDSLIGIENKKNSDGLYDAIVYYYVRCIPC